MRVPTANVIVGFDREVMDRLFTDGATYKSLIQGLTKEGELDNVLLFDNESNPNFISFEHTLGFGPGMQMTLTFIDPKGEFERRFMSDSITRNIAGFSSNKKTYNKINKAHLVDPAEAKASADVKKTLALYDKKTFSIVKKGMEQHYGEKEFFVAYGSGNNLDLWSGPHRTILTGADISVKGARKITLKLTPTAQAIQLSHRRGAYNEKVDLDLIGLTMRYSGISKPIEFTKIKENKSAYDPLKYLGLKGVTLDGTESIENAGAKTDDIRKALEKLGLNEAASELGQFDFHSIVVDALRSYVQKATGNPNVIVLLPNINVTCRQWINDSLKNSRGVSEKIQALEDAYGASAGASAGAAIGASVAGSTATPLKLNGVLLADLVKYRYDKELGDLGYKENFMSNFLSSFGLELHQVYKDGIAKSLDKKSIPSHNIAKWIAYETGTDANDRFKKYFKAFDFYAIAQKSSDKGIPNHFETIKNIINKINENAKEEYQIILGIFNETDIKLLDFWGGSIKTLPTHMFPTFGGYRDFNTQKEAVIVGDQALIQKYLYGKINLEAKFKNIEEYQEAAVLAKENQNKFEQAAMAYSWEDDTVYTDNPNFNEEDAQTSGAYVDASSLDLKALEQGEIYKAGILGSIKAIPLHPLDSVILTNKGYNKAVREIAFPAITGVGSFGDISDIPDTFGYSDKEFTDTEKDYIKKQGIPIFRYNTTNPNILDMNFKFGGVYFAQLKMGFNKMITRKASAVAEGLLPIGTGSLPIRTVGAAAAYLIQKNFSMGSSAEDRELILESLGGKVSIELMEELEVENPVDAANAVAALLDKAEQGDDEELKGYIEINQLLPGNPQSVMVDMMENIYRQALQMNIKTLPLFHVSNIHHISSPCVVFAQDAPIKQSVDAERTLLNSFFSGLYKVMGFKHTINTSTATSEFNLVKNQAKISPEPKESTK